MGRRERALSGDEGRALPQFISRQVLEGAYYFLNLEPSAGEELVVACGGWERCAADYRLERGEFAFVGIEYVVSGQGRFESGGKRFELRPGSVFGYEPGVGCMIESKGCQPLYKRFVDLSGRRAEELFAQSPLAGGSAIDLAGVEWVDELFRQLSRFGEREDAAARRSCALLAETLLLQIGEEAGPGPEVETAAYQTYLRCRQRLEERYLTLSSAAEIATAANVDQAYLTRLFQRFDEESPYRKLVRLKMSRAARALLSGTMPVKQVAAFVGYEDALHFSRVFKRTYGVSPLYFPQSLQR